MARSSKTRAGTSEPGRRLASLSRRIAPVLIALAAVGAHAGLQDYPFRVEALRQGDEYEVLAYNEGPAAVTLSARLTDAENVVSDREWPLVATVAPRQTLSLARLKRASPLAAQRFGLKYVHQFGDLAAVHDPDAVYRLPFQDGLSFVVSQAAGGIVTTHTTPDSQHAVDIAMPERTPIVAARSGMVIDIENFHVRGGREAELLDKANSVTIMHEDGTLARYVHLVAGQYTWVGQQVQAGTHIGYSGNTGYSSGPHLHFAVHALQRGGDGALGYLSLPVRFYAYDPPVVFRPEQGMVLQADYTNPGHPPPVLPVGRERGKPGAERGPAPKPAVPFADPASLRMR